MKNNVTELVFILDKSGSMSGLEEDTIGGYNAMLQKQKKEDGEARVTTVLFNHEYDLLHDRMNMKGIGPITRGEYEVGGTTALLDAIGLTIQKVDNEQRRASEEERATNVLFVITTDGFENSSKEYSYEKVKAMIMQQKAAYDWSFIFLGANIDAVSTAAKFGINKDYAVDYHADSEGTQVNFQALNEAVSSFREHGKVNRVWKKEIEKDFERRK